MKDTRFKEGNSFWLKRKKTGRQKNIKSPQALWEHACDYFSLVDSTPYIKLEQKKGNTTFPKGQKLTLKQIQAMANQIVEIPTIRPYTWEGFEDFLFSKGVISNLKDYRFNKNGAYDEFSAIISRIGTIIYAQKFEGAAVGAFNANIIARDLGLVDKSSTDVRVEQPLFPDVPENNK